MNQNYSKENKILEAVKAIFIADDVELSSEVRELNHYCAERIHRSYSFIQGLDFPQITMLAEKKQSNLSLPSSGYNLDIKIFVKMDAGYPQTVLNDIGERVDILLNKNVTSLNIAVPGLKCRMINRTDSLTVPDLIDRLYSKTLFYSMICDDEVTN